MEDFALRAGRPNAAWPWDALRGSGASARRLPRRDPLAPFSRPWSAPAVPSNLHCREAIAMARRRDALDLELAAFEKRLTEIPQVATADASAAVLSEIRGTAISEVELRRFRLALLLGLPVCGGLVLSLAFALATASARRMATA